MLLHGSLYSLLHRCSISHRSRLLHNSPAIAYRGQSIYDGCSLVSKEVRSTARANVRGRSNLKEFYVPLTSRCQRCGPNQICSTPLHNTPYHTYVELPTSQPRYRTFVRNTVNFSGKSVFTYTLLLHAVEALKKGKQCRLERLTEL